MSRHTFNSRYQRERQLSSISPLNWTVFDPSPNLVGGDGYFAAEDLAWLGTVLPRGRSMDLVRVLDLGCGRSRLAAALDPDHRRVVGVDFSIEGLRTRSGGDLSVICADIARLPLRHGTVEFAVSLDALYLCPDIEETLRALGDVLTEWGRLALTLYDDMDGLVRRRWLNAAADVGLRLIACEDTTDRWHPWLVRRHRCRLANSDLLQATFGNQIAPELSVSQQIVDGALDGTRRYWIACSTASKRT
jgi:SAM-dependent methyltransferase